MNRAGRPSDDACIICLGYYQGHDGVTVDEDGVCATCNGMMGEEDKNESS
jgi:hypothetical protein